MERTGTAWADLTADIELLGGGGEARARVAIVSYEFVGVVRNGGIGTACTELALALARDGHEVEMIFTGSGDLGGEAGFERWRAHYRERGVTLERAPHLIEQDCDSVVHSAEHSLALYRMLKGRDEQKPYDAIHFVESLGHGFYALLAKRNGLAFERATTVVCTHSARRWLAEAHQTPFAHPAELSDEFLENRSLELADVAVSPSAHLLDWCSKRGVPLPRRSYVQQYVTDFDLQDVDPPEPAPIEELVFFGRLEPRKGIFSFCDALDLLAAQPPEGLRRVAFLGKESVSREYLAERAAAWPWGWEIHSDLDRDAALEYLKAPGRLAVMASTIDNSPNVVYEALGLGLAFLASRGGGTGELVHPDDFERVTYDPRDPELREVDRAEPASTRPVHSGRVLAERLREAVAAEPRPARFAVAPAANRETHLAWHRAVAASSPPDPPEISAQVPEPIEPAELTSATGDLLLVADPAAELEPRLAAILARALARNPDASFFTGLGSFEIDVAGVGPKLFLPTGGPAAIGLVGNCAGAGVALARREAVERLGILGRPDQAPLSVAELLSRAALAGERIDVVPKVLYRLPAEAAPEGSLARAQEAYALLRPYFLDLPPAAHDIAACAARFYEEEPRLRAAAVEAAHLADLYAGLATSRGVRITRAVRRFGRSLRRLLRRAE